MVQKTDVITSYSIHYTKLYERPGGPHRSGRGAGAAGRPDYAARRPPPRCRTKPFMEETLMSNRIAALALIAALLSPAAGAFASEDPVVLTDDVAQSIRTKLTSEGYEVGKIKTEDGLFVV